MQIKDYECLCSLCFPSGVEYFELIPDHWLVEINGDYSIMCQPGHKGHIILSFPDKPIPIIDEDDETIVEF